MHACQRASYTSSPPITPVPFPLSPFLPPSQLQTSYISGAGTADEQGASAGFAQEMELIRLGREPCSGSRLTLRKGGEVDEGATALRPAAALHGLFLFLVSIRCQTNDAVSRNTTAAGVCRGGEGVGVRDRGEKATFVGRSVARLHSHSRSRDSATATATAAAAAAAAAVSTLINIIKGCVA